MTRSRGKHPNDDRLFGAKWIPIFKDALDDVCYLLTRDYGEKSATQLVGNRYRLNSRQQKALMRMSGNLHNIEKRQQKQLTIAQLENQTIVIDGFNLLILLESALSGAFIFKCQDGTYRDISSVHGSYKRVIQTEEAMLMVGETLKKFKTKHVHWYFDAPVSNSGRLKVILHEIAEKHGYSWDITLDNNPDKVLAESTDVVVSSDSWVLDETKRWFNLGKYLLEHEISEVLFFEPYQ